MMRCGDMGCMSIASLMVQGLTVLTRLVMPTRVAIAADMRSCAAGGNGDIKTEGPSERFLQLYFHFWSSPTSTSTGW